MSEIYTNRIKLRHGSTFPTASQLQQHELGVVEIGGKTIVCLQQGSNLVALNPIVGEEAPEQFFSNVANIPDGIIYHQVCIKQ